MDFYSLDEVKKNFRILDEWKINLVNDTEYKAQITCNAKDKVADLYGWDTLDQPRDFFFHECLHAAFRELRTLRGTKRYDAEEILIQDICRIIRDEE